jgi:hypothetical protein
MAEKQARADYRRRINPTMPTIIQIRPAAISK